MVRHDKVRGELEAVAEYRTDEQGTDVARRESESRTFEERIRLKTRGDVYHPDFLNYDVAVGVGLTQQHLEYDDVSSSESDTLNDYSVSAQLLRTKPLSGTFDAGKSQDLIARQFLGSLRAERENLAASAFLRSERVPMTFQYSSSETAQDGFTDVARDFFRRDDERFRYSASTAFSETSHARFDFDRTESRQESVGAIVDTETDTYRLAHDYQFGEADEHRLDSFFNYVDQTGSFDFESLRWQERLRLQHSPSLATKYNFQLIDLERDTLRSEEVRGQAGIEHRLYESLVTTADAFVSETDLDAQGSLSQHGGVLAFNYRKENPWGMLFANYTTNLTQSEQSGGGGTGVIVNETHIATELEPVQLNRTGIDVLSIRVKDTDGSFFSEGDDYTVTESNGRIWLTISTLGAIPPNFTEGQTFFVDYTFFVEPEREEETFRQNFTIRERFGNDVSLYYAYRRQDQDVRSTLTDLTPDEYTTNTVGADYARKGLFLLAEYSKEDSTQLPSTSRRLEGRYAWPIGTATSASVRVSNQWLEFEEPDKRNVTLFKSGAEIFTRLSGAYSVAAGLDYRDEDDTRFGTTRGFQLDTKLRYQFRQLDVTLGTELNFLSRRDDEIESVFVYLQARRFF